MVKSVGRPAKVIQIGLRLPKTMHLGLKRAAKVKGVSLNSELQARLKQSMKGKK